MKTSIHVLLIGLIVIACVPNKIEEKSNNSELNEGGTVDSLKKVDNNRIGEIKDVTLRTPLERDRVGRGMAIYEMKCAGCHQLSDKRLEGVGWADVTKRRSPEWIMNMITNIDIDVDQDPEVQKLLDNCVTRMPNQNLSVGDGRDILEFMRDNDKPRTPVK